jgi:hypothetical protein
MTSASDIADGVVTMLNALTTDIKFIAVKPDLLPELDRAVDAATVQVYPWEETEQSKTSSDAMLVLTRTVNVLAQCPATGKTLADCLAWLNQLKEGFRGSRISGFAWDKNESASLYDFDAMKTKQQFLSIFRATYYSFG